MKNITMGKTQRKGMVPTGCSPLATSVDAQELRYALAIGNRATRREAGRNLRKVQRKGVKV